MNNDVLLIVQETTPACCFYASGIFSVSVYQVA